MALSAANNKKMFKILLIPYKIFTIIDVFKFWNVSLSQVYQPRYMAQAPGQMPQMTSAYPGTQMYMPMHAQSVPMGAMAPSVPMAYYQMGPMYPPGSAVMVDGGYDAGARFGPGTSNSIPVSIPSKHSGSTMHLATHN